MRVGEGSRFLVLDKEGWVILMMAMIMWVYFLYFNNVTGKRKTGGDYMYL